jgi:hypothetical protein
VRRREADSGASCLSQAAAEAEAEAEAGVGKRGHGEASVWAGAEQLARSIMRLPAASCASSIVRLPARAAPSAAVDTAAAVGGGGTAMEKLRLVILRFGTARLKMVLE